MIDQGVLRLKPARLLLLAVVSCVTLTGCGGGGGLTQAQADDCNGARNAIKANPTAIENLNSDQVVTRVDAASKVEDIASTISTYYNKEKAGPIKKALRALGVVLVNAAESAVHAPMTDASFATISTALDTLNTACHIKT